MQFGELEKLIIRLASALSNYEQKIIELYEENKALQKKLEEAEKQEEKSDPAKQKE